MGGRLYGEFADGSQYTIGEITDFDPPESIQYRWKAPTWATTTTITVRFTEQGGVFACDGAGGFGLGFRSDVGMSCR